MRWVLKRLQKRYQNKSNQKRHSSNVHIRYHQPSEIKAVDKDIVDFVSKDELMLKLAQELGPNEFNEWFKETFNKPAPYIYIWRSMGRFKSKRTIINKEILDEVKKEKSR